VVVVALDVVVVGVGVVVVGAGVVVVGGWVVVLVVDVWDVGGCVGGGFVETLLFPKQISQSETQPSRGV
jgi:hypothetical protein